MINSVSRSLVEEVAEAAFVVEFGLGDLLDLGFFGVVGEVAGGVSLRTLEVESPF